jgi:RNA polymerase sigma-70 factor (ECF subfamily)
MSDIDGPSLRLPAAETGSGVRESLRRAFAELAGGDARALEAIYAAVADEIHGLALWRTGSATDAADVVQDVFVALARAASGLGEVQDPLAYLRRMVHRRSIDLHRRRSRRPEEPLGSCDLLESAVESPERQAEARRISRLVARLPAAQREAIFLRHFAGCSFAEIGRATGVPTFTAASRYRLGMRRLKRLAGVDG